MALENNHSAGRILEEALAVARAEIIDMLKSIRFAFLVVSYLVAAGFIGRALLWVNEKVEGKLLEGTTGMTDAQREMLTTSLIDQGASKYLVEAIVNGDLPPMVFGVLLGSTFSIPLLMLLVGYNRISEDVTSRYTRYLLQRVHRGSYLAGKLIGHWLVSFLAIVVVHLVLLGYAYFNDLYDMESTIAAMPRIWLAMFILVLAYSAYTMMMSATLNPPFLVLLLGGLGLVAIKVGVVILGIIYVPLGEIWMGSWDVQLYALDPAAVGVYLAYTIAFLGLAHLRLRTRDL